MPDFLGPRELEELGLAACGEGVQISRRAALLDPQNVRVGSHARIDAFCLISGSPRGVVIGSHVHLSAYVSILGRERTTIEDFCSVSVRCSLFTSSDDYLGAALSNPTVPRELTSVADAPLRLGRHSLIGTGSVILPGVTVGSAAAVGALTLVKGDVEERAVVAGNPMRRIGTRPGGQEEYERRLRVAAASRWETR